MIFILSCRLKESRSIRIPRYPKESTSSEDGIFPFTCADGWCTSKDNNYFQFSKGITIGQKAADEDCMYGDSILSVDANGSNCPSGQSSVTFGTNNKASGTYSSVSGEAGNEASRVRSSILGGINIVTTQINEIYPKESTSSGDGISPFTCADKWCTSKDNNYFQFSKGIVIGQKAADEDCIYGDGILSVDPNGLNCPSSNSSVTFGTND